MQKRGLLYAGIALYIASFMLSLPFPNNMNTYAKLSVLTIPIQTTDGIYIKGIFSLLLLLGSIACFLNIARKLKAVAVIIPLVLYLVLPSIAIPMYQAYFATGMDAISYEADKGSCQLTTLHDDKQQLYCELFMKNYSDEAVTVGVEFIGMMESAMNAQAPYIISIEPNGESPVVIDVQWTSVDDSAPQNMQTRAPNIRLVDGHQKRTM